MKYNYHVNTRAITLSWNWSWPHSILASRPNRKRKWCHTWEPM